MCPWCWVPAGIHIHASCFPELIPVINNQNFHEGLGWGFPNNLEQGSSSCVLAIPGSSCSDPELQFPSSLGICPSFFRLTSEVWEVSDTYSLCHSLLLFQLHSKLCNKISCVDFGSLSDRLLSTLGKWITSHVSGRKQLLPLVPGYSVTSPERRSGISHTPAHFVTSAICCSGCSCSGCHLKVPNCSGGAGIIIAIHRSPGPSLLVTWSTIWD